MMAGERVLIVDDNPMSTEYLAWVLRSSEYQVRTENDAAQAAVTARTFKPDIVLLDMQMPSKDGGMVAQELQQVPGVAGKPVIFVTGTVNRNDIGGDCRKIGRSHILTKPVHPRTLIDTIKRDLSSAA